MENSGAVQQVPNKRRLDHAVDLLDDVLKAESQGKAPSAKRIKLARPGLQESTPAIMELLGLNKASKMKAKSHIRLTEDALDLSDPSSLPGLMTRLATYRMATYNDKPASIDALAAARHGWSNTKEKERLQCHVCQSAWKVEYEYARLANTEQLLNITRRFIEEHKSSCPWRTRHCSDSILRLPIASHSLLLSQVISRAIAFTMQDFAQDLALNLPTAIKALDFSSLRKAINETLEKEQSRANSRATTPATPPTPLSPPATLSFSDQDLQLSLFGWKPASTSPASSKNVIISCELCLRQSVVSQLSTQKSFDPISAHRPFCPYLAETQLGVGEKLKGWQAVIKLLVYSRQIHSEEDEASLLHSRIGGSRIELLRYVRGLLGPVSASKATSSVKI